VKKYTRILFELTTDILSTNRLSEQQMAPQPSKIMLDSLKLKMDDLDLESFEYKRLMVGAGNRVSVQDTDTLRASISAIGEFYLSNYLTWDASYIYGSNKVTDLTYNMINATKMEQSIYDHKKAWFSGDVWDMPNGDAAAFSMGVEHRRDEGWYTPDLIVQEGNSTAAQQDLTSGRTIRHQFTLSLICQ
jgi:iron complex outermembrane receptor protein